MTKLKTKLLASALGVASVATPVLCALPSYAASSNDSNGANFKRQFKADPSKNGTFQLIVLEDKNGITVSSFDSAKHHFESKHNPSNASNYRSMASQEMNFAAVMMGYNAQTVEQTAQQVIKAGGQVSVSTYVDANNKMRITVSMSDKQGNKTGYNFQTPLS